MATSDHGKLLMRAQQMGRKWDELVHETVWNQHMLVKGRVTEEAALEAVRSATPDAVFGQLIKSSLSELENPVMDLHDVILAAEGLAEAMRSIAPWDDE